jgi:hypothetical protein
VFLAGFPAEISAIVSPALSRSIHCLLPPRHAILAKHLRYFIADASLMMVRRYHPNIRQGGNEIIGTVQKHHE